MPIPASRAANPYTILANALLFLLSGSGSFVAAHNANITALYGLGATLVGLGSVLLAMGSLILDRRLRQRRSPALVRKAAA